MEGIVRMLILSRSDVEQSINMRQVIEINRETYVDYSSGNTVAPIRTPIKVPEYEATSLFMPAYLPKNEGLGLKMVSVFPRNKEKGLPTIFSFVGLADAATGEPLAIMEGGYLTALRTGAATGVATAYLAKEEAETVAVIGAGIQARAQLEAVCEVRKIREVLVYARRSHVVVEYCREMKEKLDRFNITIEAAGSPEEAVNNADIIIAATNSKTPVFKGSSLKEGAHINGIGSFTPEMQEIGYDTLLRASKIVVDTREGALDEAGDLIIPIKEGRLRKQDIYAEIGEIIMGKKAGRQFTEEITFFKSVGIAALDVAVARKIYMNACAKGLGCEVSLF
jgi:alanine dehydrogenase